MRSLLLSLLLLTPSSSGAAGQGARLLAVVPEGGGKARALVEVTDHSVHLDSSSGRAADRLRGSVSEGGVIPEQVHRLVESGQKQETILAFDQSGSFARFWSEAFGLARDVFRPALDRQGARQARVMTFGIRTDLSDLVRGGAALSKVLTDVEASKPNQKATRLKASILDAARQAALDVPLGGGGLREVVVFTDAGEESDAYDVADLLHQLASLGVRVHVVCFYRGAPGQGRMAARLDQMKRLAEGSGGTYLQVEDRAAAKSSLDGIADSVESLYWIDLGFCGVPIQRPTFEDHLSLEVLSQGTRTAWTDAVPFTQHAEGEATRDCPTPSPKSQPSQAAGDQPQPQPAPQPQVRFPPPNAQGQLTEPPQLPIQPALPIEESRFPWWWLILGTLAVVVAIVLLRRRQEEPPMEPPPLEPRVKVADGPAPVAPSEPSPPPVLVPTAPWSDPFASLPETRLVVVRGPPGLEPSYRLHKREFVVGGAPGPEVDLVVAIPQVSGRHAMFQLYPTGTVFVIDQGSTNGTFVDGRQLSQGERVQLHAGQSVQLSRQLELRLDQSPQPSVAMTPSSPSSEPVADGAEEGRRAKAKTIYSPLSNRDKE